MLMCAGYRRPADTPCVLAYAPLRIRIAISVCARLCAVAHTDRVSGYRRTADTPFGACLFRCAQYGTRRILLAIPQ